MREWIERQVELLRSLRGCVVLDWHGIEMALRELGAGGLPEWRDESIPLLQLTHLALVLVDGTEAAVVTYQNFDRWGLCLRRDGLQQLTKLAKDDAACIYRSRRLDELPTGEIQDVTIRLDEEDIAEVVLHINGLELRLWAGEVYEQFDGTLRVTPMDESILVQVDRKLPWRIPR